MRVPVITVLPAQEPLRDSAAAGMRRARPTDLSNVSKPSGLELDPNFNAVPLGSGRVELSPQRPRTPPKTQRPLPSVDLWKPTAASKFLPAWTAGRFSPIPKSPTSSPAAAPRL